MLRLQWRHNHSRAERRWYAQRVCAADSDPSRRDRGPFQSTVGAVHSAHAAATAARGRDAGAAAPPRRVRSDNGDRHSAITGRSAGIPFTASSVRSGRSTRPFGTPANSSAFPVGAAANPDAVC